MFSSPVPVHLVPSIWQVFHDGIAYVAAKISLTTSAFSASIRRFDDAPPVFIVVGCSCACVEALLLLLRLRGGLLWLKEFEVSSNTPSEMIQSCQGMSLGRSWAA